MGPNCRVILQLRDGLRDPDLCKRIALTLERKRNSEIPESGWSVVVQDADYK